ncbi:MAG: NepR family anti-sigma factor [Hyphomicrobiaceae bacterium]
MSEKNSSPPRLTAPAESGESERSDLARPRAQQGGRGDATFMHNRKPNQQQGKPEQRLPSPRYSAPHGMLDRSLQAQLGRQLRAIYSDVAEEPVPDRFIRLLEELEATEKREEDR